MIDALVFVALAAVAIAVLLYREHRSARRRDCLFCGGRDGAHLTSCMIHQHRRPAA